MRKKNIILVFSFVLLSMCSSVEIFGCTLIANSHPIKTTYKQTKRCESCGKLIPSDRSCPFCN